MVCLTAKESTRPRRTTQWLSLFQVCHKCPCEFRNSLAQLPSVSCGFGILLAYVANIFGIGRRNCRPSNSYSGSVIWFFQGHFATAAYLRRIGRRQNPARARALWESLHHRRVGTCAMLGRRIALEVGQVGVVVLLQIGRCCR